MFSEFWWYLVVELLLILLFCVQLYVVLRINVGVNWYLKLILLLLNVVVWFMNGFVEKFLNFVFEYVVLIVVVLNVYVLFVLMIWYVFVLFVYVLQIGDEIDDDVELLLNMLLNWFGVCVFK